MRRNRTGRRSTPHRALPARAMPAHGRAAYHRVAGDRPGARAEPGSVAGAGSLSTGLARVKAWPLSPGLAGIETIGTGGPNARGLVLGEGALRRAAWRAQQPAGRIHVRRVECSVSRGGPPAGPASRTAGAGRTGAIRGTGSVLPVTATGVADTAAEQDEDGQHDHAEREAGHGQLGTEGYDPLIRVLAERLEREADHDKQQPAHQDDRARHHQSDDYPHTSGGGRLRAHCSTIASR